MTENIRAQCEGCGMCCRAIYLPLSQTELTKRATSMGGGSLPKYTGKHAEDGDSAFVLANFYPITGEEALSRNPHLITFRAEWMTDQDFEEYLNNHFYGCVNLNEESGRCRIHDNLSHVCSGYPWYKEGPNLNHQFYAEDCFYKRDLDGLEPFQVDKLS